jgi:hypothetical protein
MSDRGEVAPGPIGQSMSVMAAKLFLAFLMLLAIAAVLHSLSGGILP